MSARARWNKRAYQRMAAVERRGDRLLVSFEDGSRVDLEAARVLPPEVRDPDWDSMTFEVYEIIVPTAEGLIEVPSSTIRVLTDREYSAHLAAIAEEQARRVGLRIRELRRTRGLTSKELAERAGVTPQTLSRIEHGRHDVVLTTLQRILAAMGYSLRELATPPSEAASVAS